MTAPAMTLAEIVITPDTITFPVTADHISEGKPGMACQCAVAKAILDAIPGSALALVEYAAEPVCAVAWVLAAGRWTILILGEAARDAMRKLDSGEQAEPFTITATCAVADQSRIVAALASAAAGAA